MVSMAITTPSKPSEDLWEALKYYYLKNDSLFKINERESKLKNEK